eukprot:scaffold8124_cov101-Cylindrotheca_fusiformis.AAC.1
MIPKITNSTAPISGPCLEVISRINEDEEFVSSFGLVLIFIMRCTRPFLIAKEGKPSEKSEYNQEILGTFNSADSQEVKPIEGTFDSCQTRTLVATQYENPHVTK